MKTIAMDTKKLFRTGCEYPLWTVRGPHRNRNQGKTVTQFAVNGPGGWVTFHDKTESAARNAANEYAAKQSAEVSQLSFRPAA